MTYSLFRNAIVQQNTNWASTIKSNEKALGKMIDKLTKSLLGE